MRRLTDWERENALQSLREGFCWALGTLPPFIVGLLVADAVFRTGLVLFVELLLQAKP